MTEITVPAKKFQRLFDYLGRVGIDAPAVAATVERIASLPPERDLSLLD